MSTQKYKCIAHDSRESQDLTIGKEYDVSFNIPNHPLIMKNDLGLRHTFNLCDFNNKFQKVEPTTQPMRYKVTITSADHTGHEDEKVHENLSEDQLKLTIDYNKGKSILIEPMPEKQKVTVWFYVAECTTFFSYSVSHINKQVIIDGRELQIKSGVKVSEIKSMEVEI
jgi:hypothetical protein